MRLELYVDAILTRDVPDHGLRQGDVGTVVDRHREGDRVGYSLEFFDMTGRTVAVATVEADAVRTATPPDLPTVRTETAA